MVKIGASFDGGGVRGLVQAVFLKNLEKDLRKRPCDTFDCVFGTSTGGLIAMMVGQGLPGYEILNQYKKNAARIFKKKPFTGFLGGYFGPKYSSEGLISVAKEVLGDAKLGSCLIPTVVTSFALEEGAPKFWKSKSPSDTTYSCVDAVCATSAAPTYFPPHIVTHLNGVKTGYIDGGVCANSPSACLGSEMLVMFPNDEIRALSVGCGEGSQSLDSRRALGWGYVDWGKNIIGILMDGPSKIEDYIMKTALCERYLRVQKALPAWVKSDIDCVTKENLDALEKFGEQLYFEFRDDILKLLSR